MTRMLSAGLCGFLLAGCITTGNELLLNEATIAQIKVGETTSSQVRALLGEPAERRSSTMSGYAYEWWGYRVTASTVNPLEYLLLVGFLINGIGLPDTRTDLHLAFNPDGVVTSLAQQTTSYDMGWPFTPIKVTGEAARTLSIPGQAGPPLRYDDKLSTQYP